MIRQLRLRVALLICAVLLSMQSCAGWGDVFAEKRGAIGPYFLMTSGDGRPPSQYFLFERGRSGSIAGPIREMGWDQRFVLLWDDGSGGEWRIFAEDPRHFPVPSGEDERRALFERLKRTVALHTPQEIWDGAR
jgi:hypothetical protein